MTPTIMVDVDISNPGQVFACCGLFELAHRLTPKDKRAMGWFEDIEKIHTKFLIEAFDENGDEITLQSIMQKLKDCEITELEFNDKEGPVLIGEPFNFIIDWRKAYPQNESVKTWAAQQKIFKIIRELLTLLPQGDNMSDSILDYHDTTEISVTSFDVSKSENKIDVGFSNNDLKLYTISTFVVTEALALIGLQRFCPEKSIEKRYLRFYYIWDTPLNSILASIAITHPIAGINSKKMAFSMYRRDSGGRYKSFSNGKFNNN